MSDRVYDVCNDYSLDPSKLSIETVKANKAYRWATWLYRNRAAPGVPSILVGTHKKDNEIHYAIGPIGLDGRFI